MPLRFAEFSPLHRNEIAGSLSGLTRVRRFAQDDAHIFCGREHIESEIKQCLEMMRTIYNHVGFTYSLRLSTRPSSCVPVASISACFCVNGFAGTWVIWLIGTLLNWRWLPR